MEIDWKPTPINQKLCNHNSRPAAATNQTQPGESTGAALVYSLPPSVHFRQIQYETERSFHCSYALVQSPPCSHLLFTFKAFKYSFCLIGATRYQRTASDLLSCLWSLFVFTFLYYIRRLREVAHPQFRSSVPSTKATLTPL